MASMPERSLEELIVLQQHYLRKSTEIAEELAARLGEGATSPEIHRLRADRKAEQVSSRDWKGVVSIEAVLNRASEPIQQAAATILEAGLGFDDAVDAVPERPAEDRPGKYIRLVADRKTFAYVSVRADHLRIDLPIAPEQASRLKGRVRVRNVKDTNPWKVAVYVSRTDEVEAAIEAIRYVHHLLRDGRV